MFGLFLCSRTECRLGMFFSVSRADFDTGTALRLFVALKLKTKLLGCHPCLVHGCGCGSVGEGNPLDEPVPTPTPTPAGSLHMGGIHMQPTSPTKHAHVHKGVPVNSAA